MWQDYFLRARLLAVDLSLAKMPRAGLSRRVSPVECDQSDIPAFMAAVNGFLHGTLAEVRGQEHLHSNDICQV
jgi:hypothetical protein